MPALVDSPVLNHDTNRECSGIYSSQMQISNVLFSEIVTTPAKKRLPLLISPLSPFFCILVEWRSFVEGR